MNNQELNKAKVKRLYEESLQKGNPAAAEELLLEDYKQHNPQAPDGRAGFLQYVGYLEANFPERRFEIKSIFADGDSVITHIHFIRQKGDRGQAIMDIFRFEGDKIAEHWDAIQDIPEQMAHNNGMF